MLRRSAVIALLVACGGKELLYAGEDHTAATCIAAGTRVCGGTCGQLSDCPGSCVPLITGAGSPSTYGVCFSDLPDKGTTPCAVCDTGEGCVQRGSDVFVCVPLDLCADLAKLGAGDVCWYGDKSHFDGRAIIAPGACADPKPNGVPTICGGACGRCAAKYGSLDRCIGQGPDHPAGICAYLDGESPSPQTYPTCTADGRVACPTGAGEPVCAVYPSPPAEARVANVTGICLNSDDCHGLQKALPGGIQCLP